jgi:hypothetical protein
MIYSAAFPPGSAVFFALGRTELAELNVLLAKDTKAKWKVYAAPKDASGQFEPAALR